MITSEFIDHKLCVIIVKIDSLGQSGDQNKEDIEKGTPSHSGRAMHLENRTASASEIDGRCAKQDELMKECGDIYSDPVRNKMVDERPIKPGIGWFIKAITGDIIPCAVSDESFCFYY